MPHTILLRRAKQFRGARFRCAAASGEHSSILVRTLQPLEGEARAAAAPRLAQNACFRACFAIFCLLFVPFVGLLRHLSRVVGLGSLRGRLSLALPTALARVGRLRCVKRKRARCRNVHKTMRIDVYIQILFIIYI